MTFFYELKLTFSNIGSEMNTACSSFSFLTYGCYVIKKLLVTLKLSYRLLLIVILTIFRI